MRPLSAAAWLAVSAACLVAVVSAAAEAGVEAGAESGAEASDGAVLSRQQRWVVFRPMFASRSRQRALNRQWRGQELRRLSRQRGQRHRRALHFPAGGAGSGEESGLALRVAVNDLLFQSAPANDLPTVRDAAAAGVGGGAVGVLAPGAGGAPGGGGGLRPILLARLRSASGAREPAAEEEAFLLMSAAGGRPAIVPAPTTRPHQAPAPAGKRHKQAHGKHRKQHRGKDGKERRRVARDTASAASALGQRLDARLDAMEGAMAGGGVQPGLAERVKKYDAGGMYPAYSYTHGRYTRAAAAPAATTHVMKVKVHGEVDDDDEEEEMDAAETVVFRPLFVHRDIQAAKMDAKRRRLGLAKKSTKPRAKPLRLRQPQPGAVPPAKAVAPVRRVPAATAWFHHGYHRRAYQQPRPYQHQYVYQPYRRVVYYH